MFKNQLQTCLYFDLDSFYAHLSLKRVQLSTHTSGRGVSHQLGYLMVPQFKYYMKEKFHLKMKHFSQNNWRGRVNDRFHKNSIKINQNK